MRQPVTRRQMYKLAMSAFRRRSDVGMKQALKDRLLESANPFQSEQKRWPKRGVVLAVAISGLLFGSFVYFSFF
jgi:hypothetical protein